MLTDKLSRRTFLKAAAALAATLGLPCPEAAEAAPPPAPDDLADLLQLEEYLADEVQLPPLADDAWSSPPRPVTSRIVGQGGLLEVDSEQVELLDFALTVSDDYGDISADLCFSYLSQDARGGRLPDLFFGPIGGKDTSFYAVTFFIPKGGPTLQAQGCFNEIDIPFDYADGPAIVSGELALINCVLCS